MVFLVLGAIEADEVGAGQPYVVEAGDSLSSIAYGFYRDQDKWRLIQEANRDKVSADGALVQVGTVLDIPGVGEIQPRAGQSEAFRLDPATGRIQVDLVTGNDFKPYAD
ncbi:MAG: LysM peptidoglycan-binding domain-containing protein, partial [Geminicoccales bacterium]